MGDPRPCRNQRHAFSSRYRRSGLFARLAKTRRSIRRHHPSPLQGCDAIPLGALRYHTIASPAYIAKWLPNGATKTTLTNAPALTFSNKDRLQSAWLGAQFGPSFAFPTHRLASSQAFVDAATAGLGWGMNPEPLIANHLAIGRLKELIPNTPLDVHLYWQCSRLTAPALTPPDPRHAKHCRRNPTPIPVGRGVPRLSPPSSPHHPILTLPQTRQIPNPRSPIIRHEKLIQLRRPHRCAR